MRREVTKSFLGLAVPRRAPDNSVVDIADLTFLAGGGECGERMRAMDWSASPLGPPQRWPQSLKTCVRIVLTSRQPMFVWWGDKLINLYNDPYRAIVGGKHPEALGRPAAEVWSEIWSEIGPRVATVLEKNEGTYDEALLLIMERHGYPEETYYTFSYSPVPDDQGKIRGILCANTDETQRIIGERQLALLRELGLRAGQARTLAEACLRSAEALATNPRDFPFATIYLADTERREMVLAGAAGIISGHPAAGEKISLDAPKPWPFREVIAQGEIRVLSKLDPELTLPRGPWADPPRQAVMQPIVAGGTTGVLVIGLNPLRLFDDGYRRFVELVGAQIGAAFGNAQAYQDEKKRAEALAELDRAKTVFFSNVSHEFRTPLTLMLGPTEDALASPGGALSGESLRTVHRNELRLLKLVNSLLDFSRIEAGRIHACYRDTDLCALTADLASAFRATVEKAGLRLVVDCSDVPDHVFVDQDMWEKIVLNLISNAFKFTFEGTIIVSLHGRGERVELIIEDSGIGIGTEDQRRLFERFHRVQAVKARTHEGSGIGLALVAELVKLHGGTIAVDSALGRGTKFSVSIPVGHAHLPADRVSDEPKVSATARALAPYIEEAQRWIPNDAQAVEPKHGDPSFGLQAHVLLVDDNADMRDYVRRVVEGRWSVEAVADGVQALAAARKRRPDLVLTDVMMPNLDGFGLLRALRADPDLRNIPVIMLSARAGEESRIEGLEAGADDYLTKPFSARELIARLTTHLQLASMREVAESERSKLLGLLMQAPMPVAVVTGPEHHIEVANDAYCEMVGKEKITGKTVGEALSELKLVDLLDKVRRTSTPSRLREIAVTLAKRGEAYFDLVAQPFRDGSGTTQGIMLVASEVTEQVLARRRMESLRVTAEQANRAKDEFLAMLGHELRNPLAPITTALHLMRLHAGGAMEKERQVIERQVDHLSRLVDDLLDVSRIMRGKIELKRRRVEILEVLNKAIEMASPLYEQRRHRLAIDVTTSGLVVDVDAVRLAQVISNLLTNAAKYTEVGGEVSVRAERAGNEVILTVRDNGIGIAPEMLPRIFDLFVQDHQALDRSLGGLGLGLAIVRSLVTAHGGRVTAASEGKGKGSTFSIAIPAAPDMAATDRPAAPRARSSGNNKVRPEPRRILVVDDNNDAAELLAMALGMLGHSTRVAPDGPTALTMAEEFDPEIALLDIGLPVMDGYELARRLRDDPKREGLRLIAVTGYGQETDRKQSKAAGFDAHMVKPVELAALEELINQPTNV